MSIFELLEKKNDDWRAMAYNMLKKYDCFSACAPDDLVSDMYIKMHSVWGEEALERKAEQGITIQDVMYGDEVNSLYVYKAMNSQLMNKLNKQGKYITESHINGTNVDYARNTIVEGYTAVEDLNDDVESADRELVMKDFLDEVMESLDGMYWFDAKLMKVYLLDDHSMRSLAAKSKISLTTIFHNLKSTKTKLKVEFMPTYIDILNQLGDIDEANRVEAEYVKLMEEMRGSQIDIFQVIEEESKKKK